MAPNGVVLLRVSEVSFSGTCAPNVVSSLASCFGSTVNDGFAGTRSATGTARSYTTGTGYRAAMSICTSPLASRALSCAAATRFVTMIGTPGSLTSPPQHQLRSLPGCELSYISTAFAPASLAATASGPGSAPGVSSTRAIAPSADPPGRKSTTGSRQLPSNRGANGMNRGSSLIAGEPTTSSVIGGVSRRDTALNSNSEVSAGSVGIA
jgi:hypothetical protein